MHLYPGCIGKSTLIAKLTFLQARRINCSSMGSSEVDTAPAKPGLRERKKQQTRERIARVALHLFAERGYDQTTLADIAEAAEVAPRTIFAYFENKEDILLCDE